MAARNTISRLTSRIDDLTERHLPRRGPVTIVGGDEAECRRRLQEIEAAGEPVSHVRFIVTGVPRAEGAEGGMGRSDLSVSTLPPMVTTAMLGTGKGVPGAPFLPAAHRGSRSVEIAHPE